MKKIFAVSLAVAGMFTILACASAPNATGTVTEKEYEPKTKRHAACWELEITDSEGVEHDFCVTKSLYDKYEVGDKYPKG